MYVCRMYYCDLSADHQLWDNLRRKSVLISLQMHGPVSSVLSGPLRSSPLTEEV